MVKCQSVISWQVTCFALSWLVAIGVGFTLPMHHGDDDNEMPAAVLEADADALAQESGESLFFLDNVPRGVMKVKVGNKVVLDCEASGRPTPTIHWLFNGQRIAQGGSQTVADDEAAYESALVAAAGTGDAAAGSDQESAPALRVGSTKSRLFVDCFSAAQAGRYTCVAETPEGRIASSATLKIDKDHTYVPSESSCATKRSSEGTTSAARIFMWTSQRIEFEGRDVQLYCRAQGLPAPRISWFREDGKPVDVTQSRYTTLPNGDLVIKDIDWNDMGLFTCSAENDLGKDEAEVFLYPTTP